MGVRPGQLALFLTPAQLLGSAISSPKKIMQLPTLVNTRLRSTADAHIIIHAARMGLLRMVERRLDAQERAEIQVGNIYVWEERGALDLSGMGIERWTDGLRWGPSRLRNDFLFYQQREDNPRDKQVNPTIKRRETEPHDPHSGPSAAVDEMDRLIKQTYSVHVYENGQPANRRIKLHITAYFNRRSVESLSTIEHNPTLRSIVLPPGLYRSARVGKPKTSETNASSDGSYSPTERSPVLSSERDGFERLPPIVTNLHSPTLSDDFMDQQSRKTGAGYHAGPYPKARDGSYSPTIADKRAYWMSENRRDTDANPYPVLPSLRTALASVPWGPTQRNAEDDLQLSRLDIARALV